MPPLFQTDIRRSLTEIRLKSGGRRCEWTAWTLRNWGKIAFAKARRLNAAYRPKKHRFIGSNTVLCETNGRDFYGRLIGECFIQVNGRKVSLNEMMIQNGLAMAKYTDQFLIQESEAISNRRGFWACEGFEDPLSFRKTD